MTFSRVLVVEDNHEVRRMVTASIKTLGKDIEVLDVPSAEEGLVVSASQPLDLVILDIRLPGMSGLDMFARLRQRKPGLKLILVTGMENPALRKQVSEAKADAYFFKPMDVREFLNAVKRCLSTAPEPPRPEISSTAQTAPISPGRVADQPAEEAATEASTAAEPVAEEPSSVLHDQLSDLKKQVKAVAVLLVNDTGQILDEAGSASEIATSSPLLLALMHAFRASLQVSQSMARGTSESLQYFAAPRQCIYVSPVGLNHCLFVVTSGYFGPDKLGMLYHTIHLAVCDLQEILSKEAAGEKDQRHTVTPPVVAVDMETLAGVEGIFSQPSNAGRRQLADGYWEKVEKSGAADSKPNKEVLSYDQARDLGLAPSEDHQA